MVLNYYLISVNGNIILYKIVFIDYMQNIKLLVDNSRSVGCIICLFNCLYVRF